MNITLKDERKKEDMRKGKIKAQPQVSDCYYTTFLHE